MSLLRGSTSGDVEFSIERCWALISDLEHAPDWQRTLVSVAVVERDAQGRAVICDTVNDAKLMRVAVRVRVGYEAPHRLHFSQVQSEDLDAMEGGWELESLGPERTRATYTLAIDPGPVGIFARPLERAIRPLVMGHQARELADALAAGGGASV